MDELLDDSLDLLRVGLVFKGWHTIDAADRYPGCGHRLIRPWVLVLVAASIVGISKGWERNMRG